jgi:hypothetical protein
MTCGVDAPLLRVSNHRVFGKSASHLPQARLTSIAYLRRRILRQVCGNAAAIVIHAERAMLDVP